MTSKKKWVPIARVLAEWGVRGQLKCASFNPESDLIPHSSTLYLETPDGFCPFEVEEVRPHGEYWRLKLKGIGSPEEARRFRGASIALPRENLPEPPQGEIYLQDLLGYSVEGPDGKKMGKLLGWERVGGSEVFLVGENLSSAWRVPYREDFIAKTLRGEKKIILKDTALDLFDL